MAADGAGNAAATTARFQSTMTRPSRALIAVVVLALVGAGGAVLLVWWIGGSVGPVVVRETCTAEVDGRTTTVSPEQAAHAATIAAVAEARAAARAVTIALATAYQESDPRNLDHGDRDSLGLFQQRPSQGWGRQNRSRTLPTRWRFYDALVQIPDYRDLDITVAAQQVQRSAATPRRTPTQADARVLASALSGNSPGALSCSIRAASYEAQVEEPDGLTARARGPRRARGDVSGLG